MDNSTTTYNDLVRRILFSLRKNWILILAIVVVFTAIGGVYGTMKKPIYTASAVGSFRVQEHEDEIKHTDITLEASQFESFLAFCNTSVVLDRANYYLDLYEKYKGTTYNVAGGMNAFLDDIEAAEKLPLADIMDNEFRYSAQKLTADHYVRFENYIRPSQYSVVSSGGKECREFTIRLTDEDKNYASLKGSLLMISISLESNLKKEVADATSPTGTVLVPNYFNFYVFINSTLRAGANNGSVDVKRIAVIFAIIGVAVALVVVYLRYLFDRTITEKSEIERITGTSLLAVIADQGA